MTLSGIPQEIRRNLLKTLRQSQGIPRRSQGILRNLKEFPGRSDPSHVLAGLNSLFIFHTRPLQSIKVRLQKRFVCVQVSF